MRILVIGAEGTVGRAAAAALGARHDIVKAGRSTGDVRVDIADGSSIAAMFEKAGRFDAVVGCAGYEAVSSAQVGFAYVKSVEGGQTGRIYEIG